MSFLKIFIVILDCELIYLVSNHNSLVFLQKNTGQNGGKPKLDLNVQAAWAQGITGKNITTAIMDDGKLLSFLYIHAQNVK